MYKYIVRIVEQKRNNAIFRCNLHNFYSYKILIKREQCNFFSSLVQHPAKNCIYSISLSARAKTLETPRKKLNVSLLLTLSLRRTQNFSRTHTHTHTHTSAKARCYRLQSNYAIDNIMHSRGLNNARDAQKRAHAL